MQSLVKLANEKVIVRELQLADSIWGRFWGLLPRKGLEPGEGLLLTPCRGIHTFFMRFSIDALYLDDQMRVVAVFPEVKPWRLLPYLKEARQVLEVASGAVSALGVEVGDQLLLQNNTRCWESAGGRA